MSQVRAGFQDHPATQEQNQASTENPDERASEGAGAAPSFPTLRNSSEKLVRKILVPTDFSPAATKAVEHAVALAIQCGAAMTVFHVIDINAYIDAGSG